MKKIIAASFARSLIRWPVALNARNERGGEGLRRRINFSKCAAPRSPLPSPSEVIIFLKRDDRFTFSPNRIQDFTRNQLRIYSRSMTNVGRISLGERRGREINLETIPKKQKRKRIGSDLVKPITVVRVFFAKKPSLELVLWLRCKRFPA